MIQLSDSFEICLEKMQKSDSLSYQLNQQISLFSLISMNHSVHRYEQMRNDSFPICMISPDNNVDCVPRISTAEGPFC